MAQVAVYAHKLGDSQPLVAYNSESALATASNMKAVTTATALLMLGRDYKFVTQLRHTGSIAADGTLNGDLIIKGGGDPTLGYDSLEELLTLWVEKLQEKGITQIQGSIIGDASVFGSQTVPDTWNWNDMGNYYGAGATGLTIHENLYKIVFRTGKQVGDPTTVLRTAPFVPNLEIVNEVVTGEAGSGDNAYIYGSPYTYLRFVRGTLPPNEAAFTIKGSLPDPALFCAQLLKTRLEQAGVQVKEAPTTYRLLGQVPEIGHLIYEQYSQTLEEIAKETNYESVNLYAEAMVMMLGKELAEEGSTEAGCEVVKEYWAGQGVDMKGAFIEDGSGLSRFNAISARQLTQIMMKAQTLLGDKGFMPLLPVSGRSGTLKYMARGQKAEGRIYAKSGTISRVKCYTGFAKTLGGETVAFTIQFNNFDQGYRNVKRNMERIMNMLVEL